jgi:hypothetical protein
MFSHQLFCVNLIRILTSACDDYNVALCNVSQPFSSYSPINFFLKTLQVKLSSRAQTLEQPLEFFLDHMLNLLISTMKLKNVLKNVLLVKFQVLQKLIISFFRTILFKR